jgi:hypothetical protein
MSDVAADAPLPRFDRHFLEGERRFTVIGTGAIGGKASGLHRALGVLEARPAALRFDALAIAVPTLTVIATDVFDRFVERHGLRQLAAAEPGDHHVARAFQQADLPVEITGDLWDLVRQLHTPLAVRSSSLLEDAREHPFAGVYGTKMTPNDALDAEHRFQRLVEAVKFVWASAFFRDARAAIRAAGRDPDEEKMAVIVQEVVGRRHGVRFYPDVSGVARSYNFYPVGSGRPEEGVVDLALGLGKTVVDGGRTWCYSPARPAAVPPFNSIEHMLDETQTEFWAVRMGRPPIFDPTAEVEYLALAGLADADGDGTLRWVASTYDAERDRVVPGTGASGPRVLDFAPLLRLGEWPVNEAVRGLLALFAEHAGCAVEIEFALTLPEAAGEPARLGFLQVRPMALSSETVEVADELLEAPAAVIASAHALGNGTVAGVRDVVFVRRDRFTPAHTRAIAAEVEAMNRDLVAAGRPYVLVGFGRWGSADPWLGIPVTWPQIAGARAIVEAAIAGFQPDMSQGAHFFQNLLGFGVVYLSVPAGGGGHIDWDWLEALPRPAEGQWVCRAESPEPLTVRADGRSGRAVVLRQGENRDG